MPPGILVYYSQHKELWLNSLGVGLCRGAVPDFRHPGGGRSVVGILIHWSVLVKLADFNQKKAWPLPWV